MPMPLPVPMPMIIPAHAHAPEPSAADLPTLQDALSRVGAFRPMTTVQLQTSFLRPVAGDSGTVRVVARVLRLGRNLVFGEIEVLNAKGELAAHATTTCALL